MYLKYIYVVVMKITITGSHSLSENHLEKYLPLKVSEIISCGFGGIDVCAKEYALRNNIAFTEILPQWERYGENALIIRNQIIAEYSDYAIIFWDGNSQRTKNLINTFKRINKTIYIIRRKKQG